MYNAFLSAVNRIVSSHVRSELGTVPRAGLLILPYFEGFVLIILRNFNEHVLASPHFCCND